MADLPDNDDLIRRAQMGDVRAFERLVQAQIPRLRRFARAFTRDDADADDLAQEALLKIYRSLRSYRFQSSFSTWFYQVTKNCFVDARRGHEQRARLAKAVAQAPIATEAASPPEDLLLRAEERARLWGAIGGVSPPFRRVLVLCDVEGFSLAEVAAIEKVPEGTVKSRLSRGRAQLATLLQEGEEAGNPMTAANVLRTEGMDLP